MDIADSPVAPLFGAVLILAGCMVLAGILTDIRHAREKGWRPTCKSLAVELATLAGLAAVGYMTFGS